MPSFALILIAAASLSLATDSRGSVSSHSVQSLGSKAVTTYWYGTETEADPASPAVVRGKHFYLTARTIDPQKSVIVEHPYVIKEDCFADYRITTLRVDTSVDPDSFSLLVPEGMAPSGGVTGAGVLLGESWNWHSLRAVFHAPKFYVEDTNYFSPNSITGKKTNYWNNGAAFLVSEAVLHKIEKAKYLALLQEALKKKDCFRRDD